MLVFVVVAVVVVVVVAIVYVVLCEHNTEQHSSKILLNKDSS